MIPYQTCLSPCNRKLSWVSAYSTSGRCNPWFLLGHSSFAGFPSPPTSYIPSFSQKGTRSKWWGGLSIRIVTSKDSLDSAQALGLWWPLSKPHLCPLSRTSFSPTFSPQSCYVRILWLFLTGIVPQKLSQTRKVYHWLNCFIWRQINLHVEILTPRVAVFVVSVKV